MGGSGLGWEGWVFGLGWEGLRLVRTLLLSRPIHKCSKLPKLPQSKLPQYNCTQSKSTQCRNVIMNVRYCSEVLQKTVLDPVRALILLIGDFVRLLLRFSTNSGLLRLVLETCVVKLLAWHPELVW